MPNRGQVLYRGKLSPGAKDYFGYPIPVC